MLDSLAKAEDDVAEEEANNAQDDTRRSVWSEQLALVRGKSKPNFFFYMNGLLRRRISGVETPLISKVITFLLDHGSVPEEEETKQQAAVVAAATTPIDQQQQQHDVTATTPIVHTLFTCHGLAFKPAEQQNDDILFYVKNEHESFELFRFLVAGQDQHLVFDDILAQGDVETPELIPLRANNLPGASEATSLKLVHDHQQCFIRAMVQEKIIATFVLVKQNKRDALVWEPVNGPVDVPANELIAETPTETENNAVATEHGPISQVGDEKK